MLKWGLECGEHLKYIYDNDTQANNQDEEEQIDEIEDLPEYEQRNKNLRKYVDSETPTVTAILEEKKITKAQALDYLEYL